tara:strand:- start:118 stop:399 length:282 start_codon:yes stop_codon:yes gene_type:complete
MMKQVLRAGVRSLGGMSLGGRAAHEEDCREQDYQAVQCLVRRALGDGEGRRQDGRCGHADREFGAGCGCASWNKASKRSAAHRERRALRGEQS